MDAQRQKLIDRILKLLALAGGTNYAAEAATARQMAADLMARHNIDSLAQKPARTGFAIEAYTPHFAGMKWEYVLAEAAARLTGCEIYFSTDLAHYTFAGTVADLEACLYILTKLHEQRIAAWLAHKSKGSADRFHQFCFGYAKGVDARVTALLAEMRASVGKDAVLPPDKRAQIALWYEAQFGVTHHDLGLHGKPQSDAGFAAGGSASFHRGEFGQNPAPRRLTHD
jgi:hypothetical protein